MIDRILKSKSESVARRSEAIRRILLENCFECSNSVRLHFLVDKMLILSTASM